MTKIAIIGAGLSGLVVAERLHRLADVEIFEKSRGVGGRMATRYADPFEFDHGAQYFTVRRQRFQEFLEPYLNDGVVAEWPLRMVMLEEGRTPEPMDTDHVRYVGAPKMNAFAKALAEDKTVHLQTRAEAVVPDGESWQLVSDDGRDLGRFDWVVTAVPSPQASSILPDGFVHQDAIARVGMSGNFTLMLGFDSDLPLDWDGARTRYSPVGWIAVNSAKPGRDTRTSLVIQSTNEWAETFLEEDKDKVIAHLQEDAEKLIGFSLPKPALVAIHRWLYAAVPSPLGEPFLADETQRLAACGDWCVEGKVEDAFESGMALADYLEERLG
ncbi:NAD(P)/FAD-dependent oxidoreductase [Aquisalinus flavus]|uniref:Amine oxidase domain-containing protein n=1 Tax=Aquisalinus flavus TaxID=1526572 RepID=A0A8J2Y669_9PROT|nr:FAD-dependent oxidoreductase [Aquisalinus flavus]MBD0426634.1 FAD-dependent oxidoreductase [Aquisalinus flavus]UNE47822.1 hypothetical protein FF099_07045 [Aquisalinus flavus]GGD06305.1 hypothetical protein GCM10011342_13980 [Aquisalinus flavus]